MIAGLIFQQPHETQSQAAQRIKDQTEAAEKASELNRAHRTQFNLPPLDIIPISAGHYPLDHEFYLMIGEKAAETALQKVGRPAPLCPVRGPARFYCNCGARLWRR